MHLVPMQAYWISIGIAARPVERHADSTFVNLGHVDDAVLISTRNSGRRLVNMVNIDRNRVSRAVLVVRQTCKMLGHNQRKGQGLTGGPDKWRGERRILGVN